MPHFRTGVYLQFYSTRFQRTLSVHLSFVSRLTCYICNVAQDHLNKTSPVSKHINRHLLRPLNVVFTPCRQQVNEVIRCTSQYKGTVWFMLVILAWLNCNTCQWCIALNGLRFTNMSMPSCKAAFEEFGQVCLDASKCPLIEIEILFVTSLLMVLTISRSQRDLTHFQLWSIQPYSRIRDSR